MLTDPNALAAKAAEHAYSAGNLVTCDGYYEFNLDAAQAAIAALDAARGDQVARVVEWLRKRFPNRHNGIVQRIREDIAAEIERGELFND